MDQQFTQSLAFRTLPGVKIGRIVDHKTGQKISSIELDKLLQMMQNDPSMKFSPNGVLSFPLKAQGAAVIDAIEELLKSIAA